MSKKNEAEEFGNKTLAIAFITEVISAPLCFFCLFLLSRLTPEMGKFLFYFLFGLIGLVGAISFTCLIAATGASLGILIAMGLQKLDP